MGGNLCRGSALLVLSPSVGEASYNLSDSATFHPRYPMHKSVKKERLVRRIATASEAEGMFPGLLDAAPEQMAAVNQPGRIVLVNSQTERLFGYQPEELLGHDVEVLLPEHLRERHRFHRMSFLAEPRLRAMGTKMELL